MLVLLPLRGWAGVSMAMPSLPISDPSSIVVGVNGSGTDATAHVALSGVPPCHMTAEDGNAPSPDGSKCQACDWCHAAMGAAPRGAVASSAPPASDPPAALAVRDTGRAAINGLERPPRPRSA